MSNSPAVSVVMSVYNGALDLPGTVDSVLAQEDVSFEFIIVNDGSTDATANLLSEYGDRDSRIKIIEQENRGLTEALIRGCAEARGTFIARQDCGDISLPGRFRKQLNKINTREGVALVTCGSRFVDRNGTTIMEVSQTGDELERGLMANQLTEFKGVSSHPSVMFRRNLYNQVGGYRKEFVVGQDLDLWARLSDVGGVVAMPEYLIQILVESSSISGRNNDRQTAASALAFECSCLRRAGESDAGVLAIASSRLKGPASTGDGRTRAQEAKYNYFLGSCLRESDPKQARRYFKASLKCNPLHAKSLIRVMTTW